MSRLRLILYLACSVALSGSCSRADESAGYRRFFECWAFSRQGDSYELNFEAVIYPRGGVFAYNGRCPQLRLNMVFNDPPMPAGFDLFVRADEDPLRRLAFRGQAIVSIAGQEDPSVLTVAVRRLITGSTLDERQTQQIVEAMSH